MILLLLLLSLQRSPAPSIPTISLDALEHRVANGSDTTYVVNLWATWCKPCVAELPAFDKLSKQVTNKPVKVLLVSLDDISAAENVASFLKRQGFVAEVLILDEDKPHQWIDRISKEWSGAIPATIMVNNGAGKREFYERTFTFEQLSTTLETFLKRLP